MGVLTEGEDRKATARRNLKQAALSRDKGRLTAAIAEGRAASLDESELLEAMATLREEERKPTLSVLWGCCGVIVPPLCTES